MDCSTCYDPLSTLYQLENEERQLIQSMDLNLETLARYINCAMKIASRTAHTINGFESVLEVPMHIIE